ncbi:MAG: NAD(P)/FAD-dependent oxidoreductase [SAR324 cluster bacterium]|nr:NAD(P)/FAD-dependent oxidoreductase [SAR324 cluster bacterium]
MELKHVVIVGGGFAGLNAAKVLGNKKGVKVTLIDRRNHHLFQPLLYQVATAGLNPAEIAAPIRCILADKKNITVLQGEVTNVDLEQRQVFTEFGEFSYDYLILACGSKHSYFGNEKWEKDAPGLKTLEQATEIRRRILMAFEEAERVTDRNQQKQLLTFVIVGGGPTGVEMAGSISEMSRFTLERNFRNIDPKLTRVILVEAGTRILSSFSQSQSSKAMRDLETLGVQVWTSSPVTGVDADGVQIGKERIQANTVLWAAGVQASTLGKTLGVETDKQGRIVVAPDLSLTEHPEVFAAGDQAHFSDENSNPLPGLAPVALQQGRFIAKNIINELEGKQRVLFKYRDKGQMATIGRSKAVAEFKKLRVSGFIAWMGWLLIHVYYLTGLKNRIFVLMQWAWAYWTFRKGARLIMNREWRQHRVSRSSDSIPS